MIAAGQLQPGTRFMARMAPVLSVANLLAFSLYSRFDGHVDGATLQVMVEMYDVDDLDALLGAFEVIRKAGWR